METITTSKGTELTPDQIASMSEVIAKYMGFTKVKYGFRHPDKMGVYGDKAIKFKYHSSWDWLHEVWEKVSSEEVDGMNQHWYQIELALCGNDKQECFWALHRAIIYINQLKQQENDKESI